MQLTINIEDLSNLSIQSSTGVTYRLVIDEPTECVEQPTLTKRLVNQRELRELYKCGRNRIKEWVAQGLGEIPDGKSVLYDLDELEELLRSRKI